MMVDWETPEIQSKVQATIDYLMKGCSCKKRYRTGNCGCRKKGRYCGPACLCQECSNLEAETPSTEMTMKIQRTVTVKNMMVMHAMT